MPPQTDRLQILRAVLANLAGRGAIPTDAFGQTALGGQSAPNLTNQFGRTALGGSNSPSSMAAPSGFDATMRGIRLPTEPGFDATMRDIRVKPSLLSETDPYYSSVMAKTPSGDIFSPAPGDVMPGGSPASEMIPPGSTAYVKEGRYGRTALGGENSPSRKSRVSNADVTGLDAPLRGEGASDRVRPVQSSGRPAPKASTQASSKPVSKASTQTSPQASGNQAPSGASPAQQQEKASSPSKSAPVAQAEPSGEALTYFRKNKSSAGWDALGTAVSLVQQSLKPEKGGLKSRAEYDRLLRGSDNFKKLDGNEQQRVRQAFAQWMNEQTIFKGKA